MEKVFRMIRQLMGEKFWGEVIIKFKDGRIDLIHKNEQIKLD
jgi:hypothetical protein